MEETPTPVFQEPQSFVPAGAPPQPQVEAPPPAAPPKKSGGKNILIVFALLLFLVLIGVAVVRFLIPTLQKANPKEITLTWWGLWEDETIVTPLITEYQAANPHVKVQYVKQSKEDYRERLTNTLVRGAGAPDIFSFHNSWVPMFKNDLDVAPSTVLTPAEYSGDFYPVINSDLASAGIVGVPLGFDTLALFVNDDLFTTAGKSAPRTWDDLRQAALDLTIRDESGVISQAGVALGRTENVDHWQEILALMMLQNGVNLADPQGDRAQNALEFYTLFSKTDQVWDETMPTSTLAFANGKVAMYFAPSWRVFEIQALNPTLKFSVVPAPQLPKDTPTDPNITYATYWAQGVSNRSASREEAWKFLKFMSSQASLQKLYENATKTRSIGEPYPRADMANLLTSDRFAGAFVVQAPDAKSGYLASRTFDGETGINTLLSKYFEDAINAVNLNSDPAVAVETLRAGVNQILARYGLATVLPTTAP